MSWHASRKSLRLVTTGLVAALMMTAGVASASTWLAVDPNGITFGDTTAATAPTVSVEVSDLTRLSVSAHVDGLELKRFENKTGSFTELGWPMAPKCGELGEPSVPVIRELFVAPAGADVVVSYTPGRATIIDEAAAGTTLLAKPVQPSVEKIPGAMESTPFAYDEAAYAVDADLPAERVVAQELGIVRGQRLWLLEIRPVAYNPVQRTVTLWSDIAVDIDFVGGTMPLDALNPKSGLASVILNPEVLPVVAQRGSGNYLVVVAETFAADIVSFANAKAAQGYTVETYEVAPGTSNTEIKNYISSLWGGPSSPDYILLVGDTNTVPHWVGQGTGSPDTDLQYGCMDGGDDWYPDIAVGRFPARTTEHLQTMIEKTLLYESGPLLDPDYVKRAAFMASVDNYQISEGTHNYVIDTWLEPDEYACDRLYQVTYGATTQDVRDSFNDGRFYGIYSGHGGTYSWADGPPFSQDDVRNLFNDGLYAYVCSFACITGTYTVDECFIETWVREPNKGAVTAWGSSVNSYWDEDDILERVLFDAIYDEDLDKPKDVGPMYDEAKMRLLDHYGPTGTIRRYFEMYNLMGDPALGHPGQCSDAGAAQLDRAKYACEDALLARVMDCGLNLDDAEIETVTVAVDSDSETGETTVLTETNPNSATFEGEFPVSTTDGAGVLLVAEGDTITLTYIDADDGLGGTDVIVTSTAVVDCTGPTIDNITVIDLEPRSAVVTFDCDEMARGVVHYGLGCGALYDTAGGGFALSPTVVLSGLDDNTTYYFTVDAIDEAGNVTVDTDCYTFTTPEVPDFFTEEFPSGFDLQWQRLTFTPNGTVDFYDACVEPIEALPTDPAGGTTISLSDDDYQSVSVGGGPVWFYGEAYSAVYIGSNGYLTFDSGDSDYTQSLDDHFDQIRISALFDDLNPSDGGTISYTSLLDRFVVTYEEVPEFLVGGANTFQIELYFNGVITISYADVSAQDAIVGLSEGEGLSPDYYGMDLSELGDCILMGDLNCSGIVDFFDVGPFVLAVTEPATYAAQYPDCNIMAGDCNGDGAVDFFDIDMFVEIITGS